MDRRQRSGRRRRIESATTLRASTRSGARITATVGVDGLVDHVDRDPRRFDQAVVHRAARGDRQQRRASRRRQIGRHPQGQAVSPTPVPACRSPSRTRPTRPARRGGSGVGSGTDRRRAPHRWPTRRRTVRPGWAPGPRRLSRWAGRPECGARVPSPRRTPRRGTGRPCAASPRRPVGPLSAPVPAPSPLPPGRTVPRLDHVPFRAIRRRSYALARPRSLCRFCAYLLERGSTKRAGQVINARR